MILVNICNLFNRNKNINKTIVVDEKECLICLRNKDSYNNSPKNLQKLTNHKKCDCDSYFHQKCLEEWYKKQKVCPICLVTIKDNIIRENNTFSPFNSSRAINSI